MQRFETAGPAPMLRRPRVEFCKWGNSLAVRIPKALADAIKWVPKSRGTAAGKSRSLSGPIGSDSTQTRLEFDSTDNPLALAARACKAVRFGPAQCQSC
jgi:hypothetical protein